MAGVKRQVKGGACPNQKLPLTPELLIKVASRVVDEGDDKKVRFMAMITAAFLGFLRVSELLSLQAKDVTFERYAKSVTLYIRGSKTDQFCEGEKCKIMKTGKKYCAVAWFALYMIQLTGDP